MVVRGPNKPELDKPLEYNVHVSKLSSVVVVACVGTWHSLTSPTARVDHRTNLLDERDFLSGNTDCDDVDGDGGRRDVKFNDIYDSLPDERNEH